MIHTGNIKMVVLDVDGTLTDGSINILDNGSQFKKFNAKDGLGIKLLIKKGIEVAIISHSFTGEAIKARANMGNLLKGNNVAELSTVPRTTGLPQLDLLRKRKTTAFGLPARRRVRKVPSRGRTRSTLKRRRN